MKQSIKNTLSALSGFPVLRGFATGNRTGKPAEREQEVLTPQVIVDVCKATWGQIGLDPCWCKGSLTNPFHSFTYPEMNGLTEPWTENTFINPPYKDLKAWLAHGRAQPTEQIWLVPVRTHRWWWRQWRDELDVAVELNPLKFVGYKQYFPAPLLLGYRGDKHLDFCMASFDLGGVYPRRVG